MRRENSLVWGEMQAGGLQRVPAAGFPGPMPSPGSQAGQPQQRRQTVLETRHQAQAATRSKADHVKDVISEPGNLGRKLVKCQR